MALTSFLIYRFCAVRGAPDRLNTDRAIPPLQKHLIMVLNFNDIQPSNGTIPWIIRDFLSFLWINLKNGHQQGDV